MKALMVLSSFLTTGVVIVFFLAGCDRDNYSGKHATDFTGRQRTIYVQATELDAIRAVDQDPFPSETVDHFPDYFGDGENLSERSGMPGYYLFMISEDEWRIGSYLFIPQEVIAYQGEQLTFEILGVRGGAHATVLKDPDGNPVKGPDGEDIGFTVHRGELKEVKFTAEQPGIYRMICMDHLPTMVMNIHVMPRRW